MAEASWILRDDDDLVGDAERVDVASQSIEKGRRLAQAFKSGNDDAEFRLGHRQRANYRDRSVVSVADTSQLPSPANQRFSGDRSGNDAAGTLP